MNEASRPGWSSAETLLFRVGLLYFVLHLAPYPLSEFEALSWLSSPVDELKGAMAHAVGVKLLSLPDARSNMGGCGDRADHYIGAVLDLALASVGAAAWSLLGRCTHHRRLAYWATVALRFYIGYTMLEYGIIKILKSQFPEPGPIYLATPLGELQPMRLLWMLMGTSTPYTMFIGICEFSGACLLFFRRTVLAGALLSFGVLLNVFLMNVFYGVCVKLVSAHLLLGAAILILPDARRVIDVLLGRAVAARQPSHPGMSPRLTRARVALRCVVVPGLLLLAVHYGHGAWHEYGDAAPKPPLFGIWDVERFARNGQVIPTDGSDPGRWSRLAVDTENRASLLRSETKARQVIMGTHPEARQVGLRFGPASSDTVVLRYTEPEPGVLELEGELDGAPTSIRLRQRSLDEYPLVRSRFRWTSDL